MEPPRSQSGSRDFSGCFDRRGCVTSSTRSQIGRASATRYSTIVSSSMALFLLVLVLPPGRRLVDWAFVEAGAVPGALQRDVNELRDIARTRCWKAARGRWRGLRRYARRTTAEEATTGATSTRESGLAAALSEDRAGRSSESGQAQEQEDQRSGRGHPREPDTALNLKIGIVVVVVAATEEVFEAQEGNVTAVALGIVHEDVLDAIRIASTRPHLERVPGVQDEDSEDQLAPGRDAVQSGQIAQLEGLPYLGARGNDQRAGRREENQLAGVRRTIRQDSDLDVATLVVDLPTEDGRRHGHGRGQDQPEQQSRYGGYELDPSTKALCRHRFSSSHDSVRCLKLPSEQIGCQRRYMLRIP